MASADGKESKAATPEPAKLERSNSHPKIQRQSSHFAQASDAELKATAAAATKWAESDENTAGLSLSVDLARRVVTCTTVDESAFTVSLDPPHAVGAESETLDSLENNCYKFCFGDGKTFTAEQRLKKPPTIVEVLAYCVETLQKTEDWDEPAGGDDEPGAADDDGWGDEPAAPVVQDVKTTAAPSATAVKDLRAEIKDEKKLQLALKEEKEKKELLENTTLTRSRSYKVLKKDDLIPIQREIIERISGNLSVTLSAAAMLLRAARWNEEELMKMWQTPAEQQALIKKAGAGAMLRHVMQPPAENDQKVACGVCFEDFKQTETFGMRCGHRFCLSCWKDFLKSSIDSGVAAGGNALMTTCPGFKCKETVGEQIYEMLVDDTLFKKYREIQLLSFVDDNDAITWCPGKGCGNVIAFSKRRKTVACTCGVKFCFKCKEVAHAPTNCKEASDWLSRDKGSQNLDSKFLLDNTKPCPHCGVRTKKEGGCMYISCTRCSKAWCWQCGKSDHHVWECNRPPYEVGKSDKDDMNRYLFYFERYFNHGQSLKIADKQRLSAIAKMKDLVKEGLHFQRVEFLLRATELVLECRRVLQWTYVKAYNIKAKQERSLFEYRQSDLEQYTEKLNQLTEGSLDELQKNRLQVLDWTRALQRYLDNFEYEG